MLQTISKQLGTRIPLSRSEWSPRERAVLVALARTAMPGGSVIPEAGDASVERFAVQVSHYAPSIRAGLRSLLWGLELGAIAYRGRPFTRLRAAQQMAYLKSWHNGDPSRRLTLRALLSMLKVAHYDDPEIFRRMECTYMLEPPKQGERHRWMQAALTPDDFDADETLEADVVVIGSGAGGAAMAKELAEKGLAVCLLEEGKYYTREDFDGRASRAMREMYRGQGLATTMGSPPIVIPHGKTVGGSTTVNSGTCFRVPDRILHKWQNEFGLDELTPDAMAPYFDKVENILEVEEATWDTLGGCADVIKRGCDALGIDGHGPLRRNAPACDGQGVCCFGCPTDAKRSTNVSYVPLALQNHATLISRVRVGEILIENGRAVGVVAVGQVGANGTRSQRTITVRARRVVVSCGTYGTPLLLMKNRLAGTSGELGRNLSLHPASAMMAEFDQPIMGWNAIPQGYSVDHFSDERIMYEGGFTPLDIAGVAYGFFGAEYTEVMERFNHMACFGFMVEDTSRGRVRVGPGGKPMVSYNLNKADRDVVQRGNVILAEIYFAAGAKRVFPNIHGHDMLASQADVERLRTAKIKTLDISMSAYHPLGTARMGMDPATSVVDVDHQVHDVPNLYIVDGSSVPSSLGVNPQVTIMAMATRAAERMAERA